MIHKAERVILNNRRVSLAPVQSVRYAPEDKETSMEEKETKYAKTSVEPVRNVDLKKFTFDGKKADLYVNTNRLDGKHFLVTVADASGRPTLIAIHL